MSKVARLDTRELSLICQFQATVTQRAEELLARGLPLQILRLAALVDDAHCARAAESVARDVDTSGPLCKKRKLEPEPARGEELDTVPARMLLRETEAVLKRELEAFSASLDRLKLWLSLPPKTSRNPSVSLSQSDALSEVQRAQECTAAMRSSLFTAQLERLKLSSSLALTASGSSDYCSESAEFASLLDAFDENQLSLQRQYLSDLLAFHVVLVDVLQNYHDQVTGAGARSSIAVFCR